MLIPVVELMETDFGTKEKTRKVIKKILGEKGVKFQQALAQYVNRVKNDAKLLCPVGTPASTGKLNYVGGSLRNSIRATSTENIPRGSFVVGRDLILDYQIIAGGPPYINPNTKRFVDYAQAVHDGTSKISPRPFLTDAIAKNAGQFEEVHKRYLDWIENEWSKDQGVRG